MVRIGFCHRTCFCDYLNHSFPGGTWQKNIKAFLTSYCHVYVLFSFTSSILFTPEGQSGVRAGLVSLLALAEFPSTCWAAQLLTVMLLPPVFTSVVRVLSGTPHEPLWWCPPEELRAEPSKQCPNARQCTHCRMAGEGSGELLQLPFTVQKEHLELFNPAFYLKQDTELYQ